MKILNTKNADSHAIKMLIYGESGAGKTSLARTIKEPVIVVSSEGGLLSIADAGLDYIDVTRDDNGNAIPKEKRLERVGEAYKFLSTEKHQYKWVFIDSITEIGQNVVEKLQVEFPERKDGLVLWGEYAKRMRSLIKAFRDLHMNVIMTALCVIEKDDMGRKMTKIDLNGKVGEQMPQFLDEVFYLNADQDGKRTLVTNRTSNILAKDRSGCLGKTEEADLSLIVEKIRKGKKNV